MKNNKQIFILFYSILIPPVMMLVFSVISHHFGKTIGYILPYGIYLSILFVGILYFSILSKDQTPMKINHNGFCYVLAFIPVIATFLAAFLPTAKDITATLLLVTFCYALLNGVLEELFWRYTFQHMFGSNLVLAFIVPTIIFSCWHFALLFANGISYHGGALALVGGAAMMGTIWG